jgi:ppGpp synthetase/RelA/SpoT-type nucleotidyltranferase
MSSETAPPTPPPTDNAPADTQPPAPVPNLQAVDTPTPFDFEAHRLRAIDHYQKRRAVYEGYGQRLRDILQEALRSGGLRAASIEARAKSVTSFGIKAALPSEHDPNAPKYANPLADITDLTGVRIIVFFPSDLTQVDAAIHRQLLVKEKIDKGVVLRREGRFGYESVHYLVQLTPERVAFPEYARYKRLVGEIQVRTILQHAWAEIEHDIQYKSADVIPASIGRRFLALASLLELADREFQAIQLEDKRQRAAAQSLVKLGNIAQVEITPDALKTYLDKILGPDGRMTEYGYEAEARSLSAIGFRTIGQIAECIQGYDDDVISRAQWGSRVGQLARFQGLLMAGMGASYIAKRYSSEPWLRNYQSTLLDRLRKADIAIGNYAPLPTTPPTQPEASAGREADVAPPDLPAQGA